MPSVLIIKPGALLEFDYVNYRGESSHRRIKVNRTLYGNNKYHPIPQWMIDGDDLDKKERREFAMRDMTNVTGIEPPYHKPTVQDSRDFHGV